MREQDMCKLVSQFRAHELNPPTLTEIDGRNFYAVLLRVETIHTILLTTTTIYVGYQSSWCIYRRWRPLYKIIIEYKFALSV